MNFSVIIQWFSGAILVLALSMIAPLVFAYAIGDVAQVKLFGISILLALFIGGGAYLSFWQRHNKRDSNDIREAIIVLVTWWFLTPFIAALPFFLDGYSLADGWYEAVTGLTTTGAWISAEQLQLSQVQMLWRALLQALGGFASISIAAAIFVRPEFTGIETMTPPFARGERESYLRALRAAMRAFAPIYASLIALLISVLLVAGVPVFDAVLMGLSLIASGGFIPGSEGFASYSSLAMFPIFIGIVLGGVNFILIVNIIHKSKGRARRNTTETETPIFLMLIPIIGICLWFSTGASSTQDMFEQIFNAASFLSTNGFHIGQKPALIPVLVTVVIGGSAVSAAGGIKILRWLITLQQAGDEIWKLNHPHGIARRQQSRDDLTVWIHFIAFALILSGLVLCITIFGHTLELSVTTAVAVISNAGPLIAMSPEGFSDYATFSPSLRVLLAIGMIFGRIELVIALSVLNRNFWRLQ